jgi:molecular chaperone GrpE
MMINDHENNEEIIPEPDTTTDDLELDETEGNLVARVRRLKDELLVSQKERKEYLDGWQRSKADYMNLSRRFDEERRILSERSESAVIEKILPLCDSFEMAFIHTAEERGVWVDGLSRIHSQLLSILNDLGVSAVGTVGEKFDPRMHEALKSEVVEDESRIDTIVAVLQKGYKRGDILIRPAKVTIGVAA